MRQNSVRIFCVVCSIFGLFSPLSHAEAETLSNLPATPVAQRFFPADSNGDTGMHDCMAAAFTTALLTLSDTGNLSVPRETITYETIRHVLRAQVPDPTRGIAPTVLLGVTPTVTQGAFSLLQEQVDAVSWEPFLRRELAAGRPVLVHIQDRNQLYNLPHRTDTSHVIVVYGIGDGTVSFTDSWDGVSHTLPAGQFAMAWGNGYYRWLSWRFIGNT